MEIVQAIEQMGDAIRWILGAIAVAVIVGGFGFTFLAEYFQQRARAKNRVWKNY